MKTVEENEGNWKLKDYDNDGKYEIMIYLGNFMLGWYEEAISNAVYDSEDILDEYVFDNTLQEEYETFELYGRALIEKLMYELDMTGQVLLPNKAYVRQYKEDDYHIVTGKQIGRAHV